MGYMGFGMQKENYTRKPKKTFEKFIKKFGNKHPVSTDDVMNQEIGHRKEFKQFHQTNLFKLILISLLSALLFYIIWTSILERSYFIYDQHQFEVKGIHSYFKRVRVEMLLLKRLVKNENKRIVSLEYHWDNEFSLQIRDERIKDMASYNLYTINKSYSGEESKLDSIVNDELIMPDGNVREKDWVYFFRFKANEINSYQVLNYLRISRKNLLVILNFMKKHNMKLANRDGLIFISFTHEKYGVYELIFTQEDKRPVLTSSKYEMTRGGLLEDGMYWCKNEIVR